MDFKSWVFKFGGNFPLFNAADLLKLMAWYLGDHFLIDLIVGNIIYGLLVSDGITFLLLSKEMKPPREATFHNQLLSCCKSLWGPQKNSWLFFSECFSVIWHGFDGRIKVMEKKYLSHFMLFFFVMLWYLKHSNLVDFSFQDEKFPMDALDL